MTYNKKSLGPVITFIIWISLLGVICIIGISNVFAATTNNWGTNIEHPNQSYFYDCTSNGCYTDCTSSNGVGFDGSNNEYGIYWAYSINTVANSYGAMAVINPNTRLLKDKIYSTTIYICSQYSYIVPINLYTGSLSQVQSRSYSVDQLSGYINSNLGSSYPYTRIELGDAIINPSIENCRAVSFTYTSKVNSSSIGFQFTTGSTVTGNFYLIGYDHEYLGDSNSLSEEQVDTIINNQTTVIQNNINNMQSSISSDIKDTENNINSNIDDMEESINGTINDNFNTCRYSVNLFNGTFRQGSTSSNSETSRLFSTQVIYLENGTYTFSTNASQQFYILTTTGNTPTTSSIIDSPWSSDSYTFTVTTPSYFWVGLKNSDSSSITPSNIANYEFQLEKGSVSTNYEKFGEQICTNKLDEQNETSKGILGKIKDILSYINPFSENFFAYKLVELIINGLKSLIVPDNFDFINDFKDVLEAKLGFIASVPIQLLDYLISFKDKAFTPVTSITFPKMTFFGYSFWNEMQIDISQGLGWISAFKYLTDFGCVVIMVNTLRKWYANFTGGDEK